MVWSGSVATASVLIVVSSLSGLFGASVEHVVNAGADAVIGGDPIRVSMFIDTAEHTGNRTLMLPRPLSDTGTDIAALESLAGNGVDIAPFRDWVRAQAGGEPEHSFVKLVVEGRRRFTTVRIIDIKADIVKRGEPLKGTLFYDFYDGADPLTRIGFNLDENVPVAREIGDDGLGDPYFQTKATITLTYGEVEVFEITAGTAEHYVEWCIDLSLLIDGQSETVTVCPPDGQPMRTTAYHEPANKADSQFSAYQEMYRWWSSPLFRKVNPQTAGSHSD